MRIAAVHQFTGKKSWVSNLSGSLSKIATHPKCPERSVSFLQSNHSAKTMCCELEFYEAAVGDLTLPASRSHSTGEPVEPVRTVSGPLCCGPVVALPIGEGHNLQMNIADLADDSQPPKPRKKTALEKLAEDMERHLAPFRQIQEMQDLVRRYRPEYQARELLKQIERERQQRELLERAVISRQFEEMLESTSIAAQAQRMLEQYIPKNSHAQHAEILRRTAGLASASEAARAYEKFLAPVTMQQEWLEKLQRQTFGGLSIQDLARQFEQVPPAFAAMEAAKKSLDTLWGSFRDIDFSGYEADDEATKEAEAAALSITQATSGEPTLKEAVDQIIAAIQSQQKPAVQLMLLLLFRKMLDWLIAGAIGAVMGYYAPQVLGESPQATSKAVKAIARDAVGSPELLLQYRYISAKVLIVRQNPRALSPEVGRLTFGKVVKLLKKDKDFALVYWTDRESGAEMQGWVFSRYLGNFN